MLNGLDPDAAFSAYRCGLGFRLFTRRNLQGVFPEALIHCWCCGSRRDRRRNDPESFWLLNLQPSLCKLLLYLERRFAEQTRQQG